MSATSLVAEAYPVEVAHKIIILPPKCYNGEEYDKMSDKCVPKCSNGEEYDKVSNKCAPPDRPVSHDHA